jgi:hypothetical protein
VGRLLGHQELLERKQSGLGGGTQGSLGFRVEVAERVDLVPEELDADGMAQAGGEAIQDPAADRKFSRLRDLTDGAVAARREGAEQLLPRRDPLGVERHDRTLEGRRTDRPWERRRHRRHQDAGLARQQPVERLDPTGARLQVLFALQQERHHIPEEKGQIPGQRRRHFVAATQDQERPSGARLPSGQGQGAGGAVQTAEDRLRGGLEILSEIGELACTPKILWEHDD